LTSRARSWPDNYSINAVAETYDGGAVLAAVKDNAAAMIKCSQTGSQLWENVYSPAFIESPESVIENPDHSLILSGMTYSYGPYGDYFIIKTDQNGNRIW